MAIGTRSKNADTHPGYPDKPPPRRSKEEIEAEKEAKMAKKAAKEAAKEEALIKKQKGIETVAAFEARLLIDTRTAEGQEKLPPKKRPERHCAQAATSKSAPSSRASADHEDLETEPSGEEFQLDPTSELTSAGDDEASMAEDTPHPSPKKKGTQKPRKNQKTDGEKESMREEIRRLREKLDKAQAPRNAPDGDHASLINNADTIPRKPTKPSKGKTKSVHRNLPIVTR